MIGIAVGVAAVAGVAFGWWGLALTALVLGLARISRAPHISLGTCAVVLVTALLGVWRGEGVRHAVSAEANPAGWEEVLVVSAPEQRDRQQFVVIPDPGVGARNGGGSARLCVVAPALPRVGLGDRLRLTGDEQEARDVSDATRLFLGFRECQAQLFAKGVQLVASGAGPERSLADLRGAISGVLRRAAPGDAGVLLSGLVTGDDAGLSDERARAFIRTGTTHLTAVSGANLALVAGMLATAGTVTIGRHRPAWQAFTLIAIWGYAFLSGAQAPVVRAALVASAAVLAFRFGRRPDFVTLILLAAGLMALTDPDHVEALGFRLSVAASLALAVVVPPLLARQRGSLPAMIMGTAAAQIATLPLLLPVFGTMSWTSLLANLAAAPLVAIAMPFAALGAAIGLVWSPLAELFVAPAALAAALLLEIVDRLGAPSAIVAVGVPTTAVAGLIAVAVVGMLAIVSRSPRKGIW